MHFQNAVLYIYYIHKYIFIYIYICIFLLVEIFLRFQKSLLSRILNCYLIFLSLVSLLNFVGLYIVLQLEELKSSHNITVTSTKDTSDDEDENDKLWRTNGVAHRRLMDFLYNSQEKKCDFLFLKGMWRLAIKKKKKGMWRPYAMHVWRGRKPFAKKWNCMSFLSFFLPLIIWHCLLLRSLSRYFCQFCSDVFDVHSKMKLKCSMEMAEL